MHPLVASRWYPMGRITSLEWKTCSVEAGDGFSKLTPCERRVQIGKEASKTRDCCVAKNPSVAFAPSGQAATLRAARPDASRDKKRLAQDDNPTGRTLAEAAWPKRPSFESGMQKDGLTMFPMSCYICRVPRVNPGLLCAVSSGESVRELAVELLRNTFPV